MATPKQTSDEVRTRGVSAVHGAVSDTIVAVGDALSTVVHVTGNVGEEVVNTVGRVGRSGIREAGGMLTDLAGGLRGGFDAMFTRRGTSGTGTVEKADRPL